MSKETKTIVQLGEFEGHPTFKIIEVDEEGYKNKYPVITVGVKKAKAILKNIKALEDFVKANDK
jgi:hypothetical protein